MKLVTSWNPAFIQTLVEKVQSHLSDFYSEANPSEFADEEDCINLNEMEQAEAALESVLENEGLNGLIGSDDFADLSFDVFRAIPQSFFEEIESEYREQLEDAALYHRNPLAYYGMSQRDFL
jgi:hypothetical protein